MRKVEVGLTGVLLDWNQLEAAVAAVDTNNL